MLSDDGALAVLAEVRALDPSLSEPVERASQAIAADQQAGCAE